MRRFPLKGFGSLFVLFVAPLILRADIPVVSVGSASVFTGNTVTIPVDITGVSDLAAFQFNLSFNPAIVHLQAIKEGAFLPSAGPTFFIPGTIDNVAGSADSTADSLLGPIAGATGSGTLATLRFQGVNLGTSPVVLSDVILLDSNLNDIAFTTTPGAVTVVPELNAVWLLITVACCCVPLARRRQKIQIT